MNMDEFWPQKLLMGIICKLKGYVHSLLWKYYILSVKKYFVISTTKLSVKNKGIECFSCILYIYVVTTESPKRSETILDYEYKVYFDKLMFNYSQIMHMCIKIYPLFYHFLLHVYRIVN